MLTNFDKTYKDRFDSRFNQSCSFDYKSSCNFIMTKDDFPPINCSEPMKMNSDYVYFVQAVCKSDDIDLFLQGKYYLSKELIAFIVVCVDIGISFLLFFLF